MMTRQAYDYALLRYVPDDLTGEFVNVGVVGFLRERPLAVQWAFGRFELPKRINMLFPEVKAWAAKRHLQAVESAFLQMAEDSRNLLSPADSVEILLSRILPSSNGALQWSQSAAGVTDDLAAAIDKLFRRYVRAGAPVIKRKTDDDVWRPVEAKLRELALPIEFETVEVAGETDSLPLKKCWRNGQLHAYEPLSLDLANAEEIKDKARKWRGRLDAAGQTAEPVALHFVVAQPGDASLTHAYQDALKILGGAVGHPEIVPEDGVGRLVRDIKMLFEAHVAHDSLIAMKHSLPPSLSGPSVLNPVLPPPSGPRLLK